MAIKSIAKSFNTIFKRSTKPKTPPPQQATTIVSPRSVHMSISPTTNNKEDEFRQVFKFLDTNNDGKISSEELRSYFASIGDHSITLDQAKKIIREFSQEDSSSSSDHSLLLMGFEDFVRVLETRDSEDDDDDHEILRQVFEVYEVEKGSGVITPEGLRQVLRRLGDVKSTVEECKGMIRVFDLDGNGVLDFDEFYKMMVIS